jgi:hypothetical protein
MWCAFVEESLLMFNGWNEESGQSLTRLMFCQQSVDSHPERCASKLKAIMSDFRVGASRRLQ